MNLLLITADTSIPEGRKGALWHLLQELKGHWHRIDVLCARPHGYKKATQKEGMQDIQEGGSVRIHTSPTGAFGFAKWAKKRGAELHAEVGYSLISVQEKPPLCAGVGAKLLHEATGVPYVLNVSHIPRNRGNVDWKERLQHGWYKRGFLQAAERAAAIRVPSIDIHRALSAWDIPKEKLHVLPTDGVDRKVIEETPAPPIAYDVCFCNPLRRGSGILELLEMCGHMPTLRMLVIGDGPQRKKAGQLVKKYKLEGRVTFTEHMPSYKAVISAMKSTRMLVCNARDTRGAHVVLEAMGAGVPVIATKVGVAQEAIQDGNNGLFTTGKGKDMLQKIEQLLSNDEKRKWMGQQASKILDTYDRTHRMVEYATFLKSFACVSSS